jgi:hypothetical protein
MMSDPENKTPTLYSLMSTKERSIFNRVASLCGVAGSEELEVVLGSANNFIVSLCQQRDAPDIWRGLMAACDEVVVRKGRDYQKGSPDRLANFREAGDEAGITPLQAWVVFFNKHIAAIKNYIKTGGQSESEPIMGRFVDAINYLRLGWLLVLDVQEAKEAKEAAEARKEGKGGSEGQKQNYVAGAGRYQEAPGVGLTDGGTGRKFELRGRGANSVVAVYDGFSDDELTHAFNVSWLGELIRAGRVLPIDGTPP